MSKVITTDLGRQFTKATIRNMDSYLDVFMDAIGCDTLTDRFPKTSLVINTPLPIDDYFEVGPLLVISDRLQVLLENRDVHAEYFQLRVLVDGDEYTKENYYFCHLLDCCDCFDYKRSTYSTHTKPGFTGRINAIEQLAIDGQVAEGHQMFRLSNGAEYIVCVSDILASELSASNFIGMKIISPEDWFFGC